MRAEVICLVDPPVELTRVLADWNTPGTDDNAWRPDGLARDPDVKTGRARLAGDGSLRFYDAPHPNRFPFIRLSAYGGSGPDSGIVFSASPHTPANMRPLDVPAGGLNGEHTVRLPPDRILTSQAYFGRSLRLAVKQGSDALAVDYVMADAVPTRALAEFDSAFERLPVVEGVDRDLVERVEGCLRIPWTTGAAIVFDLPQPAERPWDAIDLRLRVTGAGNAAPHVRLLWESGRVRGVYRLPVRPGEDFHLYRLHLHKEPSWRPPQELRLELHSTDGAEAGFLDLDYLRLRDFPNPGGGNISNGLLAFDKNPGDWQETARLLDRWRFVAGQSYRGNQARIWQGLGRSFQSNRIRWETDHPTWNWLLERTQWPRRPDGQPDLEAAARLAYESLNASAQFLERRGSRLEAVHFDGLFKRLLLPQSHPRDGASPDGGLLEFTGGDHRAAYRMAAETFCAFMALARNRPDSALKSTRFYIQPNFHAWAWRHGALNYRRIFQNHPAPGNFREMMEALEAADRGYLAKGAYQAPSPLAGYGADWVFMKAQPRRLVSFEWCATEEFGREFIVVNNGTVSGKSPAERSLESLRHLLQFREEGGRPTSYTPYFWQTTWREAPPYGEDGASVLPETEPHTVAWTLLHSARLCLFMEPESFPGE